jgi:hypothetical protein
VSRRADPGTGSKRGSTLTSCGTASLSDASNLVTYDAFKLLYTVGDELGQGGFGTVFAATRNSDGTPLAVKQIAKNRPMTLEAAKSKGQKERYIPLEIALMLQTKHIAGHLNAFVFSLDNRTGQK